VCCTIWIVEERGYSKRKHTRLDAWDYSSPWWYFVTICTTDMRRLFGKIVNETMVLNNEGSVVDEEWKSTEIVRTNVKLDMFQVMPNHMHMVFEIVDMPFRRGVPRTPTLIETGASIAPLHRQPQSVGSISKQRSYVKNMATGLL